MAAVKRKPTPPGAVLLQEFLQPPGRTQAAFAEHRGSPLQRIDGIIRGKRAITPETAWLLAQALGKTPEFWLNLQGAHDLAVSKPARSIRPVRRVS